MPKYTTTLPANTYTATDFSTTLKTAFDNLGWGTGKVDIVGGYRYTATDETNSNSTPYSLTTFLENYSGSNIVRPHSDWYGNGEAMLAAYLPGVKSYRIKFTPISDKLANGTSVTFGNTNTTQTMYASYYNGRYNSNSTSVIDGNNPCVTLERFTVPNSLDIGTQYTTSWTTGRVNAAPAVMFHLGNVNYSLRIDAIEWTVDQNKFAFQSPNLDSPTFEVYSVNDNGTLYTTLVSYPIKNANTPIAKLGVTNVSLSTHFTADSPMKAHMRFWHRLLFHTHVSNLLTRGRLINPLHVETLSYANFATDLTVRAGNNTTYDGFFFNTQQGSSFQGTYWDSVDKTTAFPLPTPQFPPQRLMSLTGGLSSADSWNSSNTSYFNTLRNRGGYLFTVNNQRTVSNISIKHPGGGTSGSEVSSATVAIYKVTTSGSDVIYESVIIPPTQISLPRLRTVRTAIPGTENLTLAAGQYAVVVQCEGYFFGMSDVYSDSASQHVNTLEGGFVGRFQHAVSKSNLLGTNIRYIRDYVRGREGDNSTSLWVELEAINTSDVNVALNKTVTSSQVVTWGTNQVFTNGDKNAGNYVGINNSNGGWLQVDLGQTYNDIKEIKIWRYYGDTRRHADNLLQVSTDGVTWTTVYDASLDGVLPYESASGISYTTKHTLSLLDTTSLTAGVTKINLTGGSSVSIPSSEFEIDFAFIGSGTPCSTIGSYAENWCSLARTDLCTSATNFSSKLSRSGGDTTGASFMTSFPFGLDIQMKQRSVEAYLLEAYPGYENNPHASDNSAKFIRLEFADGTSNFNGGSFHRAWATRYYGTSVRHKNIYLLYKDIGGIGVSFTTPDGSEYVCVARPSDYTNRCVLFRLK